MKYIVWCDGESMDPREKTNATWSTTERMARVELAEHRVPYFVARRRPAIGRHHLNQGRLVCFTAQANSRIPGETPVGRQLVVTLIKARYNESIQPGEVRFHHEYRA